ncbi:MAG: sortase [Chloroflexi bacterium]|nr:sortase [Chloroflexota bacterium]
MIERADSGGRWRRRVAWALILVGLSLVALPAAYFGYAAVARSQVRQVEASLAPDEYRAWAIQPPGASPGPSGKAQGYSGPLQVGDYSANGYADPSVPYEVAQQRLPNGLSISQLLDLIGSAERMVAPPRPPGEPPPPAAAPPTPVPLPKDEDLPASARAALRLAQPSPGADETRARQIRIPSIAVDAPIKEIRQVVEEGKLVWERPKWVVGQLQGTSNPGQGGNAVMAGHLESPIRGEGNVFENLPGVRLLESVYVETERARYEYRVVQKRVVEPNDLEALADTKDATLTLITCTPRSDGYSRRVLVIAKLFRVEELPSPATSTSG